MVVTNQVFPTPGIKDPVLPTCVVFYVTPHLTCVNKVSSTYLNLHIIDSSSEKINIIFCNNFNYVTPKKRCKENNMNIHIKYTYIHTYIYNIHTLYTYLHK